MVHVNPMNMTNLGNTGLVVSELCFGSLSLGREQYDLDPNRAEEVLHHAWGEGVRFFDTAEAYGTYAHLRSVSSLPGAVIASRSYAVTACEMQRSLTMYREELGREVVDIFGLHEQESGLTLKGHAGAIGFLAEQKRQGLLRAVSVSTHSVPCVRAAAMHDDIDVIFAMLNVDGLGIQGGSRSDMEDALRLAYDAGKGIYLMKVLGGGHLHKDPGRALDYVRQFKWKHSICVGFRDEYEVEFAARLLQGLEPPSVPEGRASESRRLVVEDWCEGCGECVRTCPFDALVVAGGSARVDPEKCMLCGYCARVCPHFCLKVV